MAPGSAHADVLSVTAGLRASEPSAGSEAATDAAVRRIIGRSVSVDAAGEIVDYTAYPAAADASIEAVLVDATVYRVSTGATRSCTVVAVAAVDPATTLTGSVLLRRPDGVVVQRSTLSGDVLVTDAVDTADAGVLEVAVSGAVVSSTPDPDPEPTPEPPAQPAPVPTPRTAAEKAAARRTYDAALKDARRKYAKAKKKAGRSKSKKNAARKAYVRRKSLAKTRYRAAIADVPAVPTRAAVGSAQATTNASAAAGTTFDVAISTDAGWFVAD